MYFLDKLMACEYRMYKMEVYSGIKACWSYCQVLGLLSLFKLYIALSNSLNGK